MAPLPPEGPSAKGKSDGPLKFSGQATVWYTFLVRGVLEDGVISGRVGGEYFGKDLDLEWTGTRFSGRVGGAVVGFDVGIVVEGSQAHGRLGGFPSGVDVHLTGHEKAVRGRVGGQVIGADVLLHCFEQGVRGVVDGGWLAGGSGAAKLRAPGMDKILASLLCVICWYTLRRSQERRG